MLFPTIHALGWLSGVVKVVVGLIDIFSMQIVPWAECTPPLQLHALNSITNLTQSHMFLSIDIALQSRSLLSDACDNLGLTRLTSDIEPRHDKPNT